jgi:hypothetical protein
MARQWRNGRPPGGVAVSTTSDTERKLAEAERAAAFEMIVRLLPRLSGDQRRALQALLQKPDAVRPPPDPSTLIG